MNKKIMIFFLVVITILIVGGIAGTWYIQNNKYKTESQKIDQEIYNAEQEIVKIEAMKDKNGYTPTDIVNNFMNEIKNGSSDKAKLYLATELQALDVLNLVGFSNELDKINIQEVTQEVVDKTATVNMKGYWPDESKTFQKNFILVQEEDIWKVKEIQTT
jgi:hypothetical protein